MERNILIGGEAGQGLVTVGEVLSKSFVRSGYYIVVEQSYQSRIRGGHNTFAIRVSDTKIFSSLNKYDVLIAFNRETIDLHSKDLKKESLIISDDSVCIKSSNAVCVPFKNLADKRFENTVFLGIVGSILGLDQKIILGAIKDYFSKKDEKIIDENKLALEKSYSWAIENIKPDIIDLHKLSHVESKQNSMMLNGNQAIALGAISAGLKFLSYYPMTPATSIAQTVISHANDMNIVVEQVEDEISAINMAIGASFAGAPSMVSSSGGGFALMVEGVSLSAMTETPLVIAVASRPSPATGLPTRTEQGDLEFVLHSGHGEFARAIFAPGTVEECFDLTRKSFFLAEKHQTPIFILTDQYLADSYRTVDMFDLSKLNQVELDLSNKDFDQDYERYKMTSSGISKRLIPGVSKNLVIADSDEHTADGHLTEDLSVRVKMVDKRLRKLEGLKEEVIKPVFHGMENSDVLFVCFGSTYGSVFETVNRLKNNSITASMLHFSQVWPIIPDQFLSYLTNAKKIISVEGNATGQFARLIMREAGFNIKNKILRYDGLQISSEYILEKLEDFL